MGETVLVRIEGNPSAFYQATVSAELFAKVRIG